MVYQKVLLSVGSAKDNTFASPDENSLVAVGQ